MGGGGQGLPVGAQVARLGMAGDKHHPVRVFTVRERHAQRGDGGQTGRDAVDHGHRDACRLQVLHFFAAPAKYKGVAAFEAHHGFAFTHRHEGEPLDKGLGCGFAAAALAHMDDAGRGGGQRHNGVAHQVVHQQHGGDLNRLEGLDGEQFGVARACADQGAGARADRGGGVVVHVVVLVCLDSCTICATCKAMGAGTGSVPASTAAIQVAVLATSGVGRPGTLTSEPFCVSCTRMTWP